MDYHLYRKLRGKIQLNDTLTEHSNYPLLNLRAPEYLKPENIDIEIPQRERLGFGFEPFGVLVPGEESSDIADRFAMQKSLWLKDLKRLKPKNGRRALRELKHFQCSLDSRMSVKVRRYVEHMRLDPLPGFDGERNWLFSGGTITSVPDNGEGSSSFLVTCGGPGLSSVGQFKVSEDGQLQDDSSTQLKINEPILQVATNRSPDNPLVCVRQMHNVNVLRPSGLSFQVALKKKVSRPHFFSSVGMKDGQLAVAKSTGSVALFDVEVNKMNFMSRAPGTKVCPVQNMWNQVHWNENGLWVFNQKMVCQVDQRGPLNTWNMSESLEDCEEVCDVIESCCDSQSSYVATNHNLLQVDVRQQKMVQKWTHMMSSPPDYGQTIKMGEDELIVLQSQNADEGVAIRGGPAFNLVPPRAVPSLAESLRAAQLQGHCLDPDTSKRTDFTVIGSHLFEKNGVVHQATQNSGGDVFIRGVRNVGSQADEWRTQATNSEQLNTWSEYEDRCSLLPVADRPVCSEVVDMTNAFNLLQIPNQDQSRAQMPTIDWCHREQFARESLLQYKDALAQRMLRVWGHQPDETSEEEAPNSELKVEEWLSRHVNE